jgi:hypothetical protein
MIMPRTVHQKKKKMIQNSLFKPKEIANYYFKDIFVEKKDKDGEVVRDNNGEIELDRKRECRCGLVLMPTKTGYTNEMLCFDRI